MNEAAAGFWEKALDALRAANYVLPASAEAAASRAYYGAFYALSALFADRGLTFTKHTAVQAAMHHQLIKTGLLPPRLGELYAYLLKVRGTGDYSPLVRVTPDEARKAIDAAVEVTRAVAGLQPADFRYPADL